MAAVIFGIAILAAVAGHPLTVLPLIGPIIGPIMYPVILVSGLICGLRRFS